MILSVNGQQVALKKSSTVECVLKNRTFADADDYSLEIELPLAEWSQNLDICYIVRGGSESREWGLERECARVGSGDWNVSARESGVGIGT